MKREKPWWRAAVILGSLVGIGLLVLVARSPSSPDEEAAVETAPTTSTTRRTTTTKRTTTTRRPTTTTTAAPVPVSIQREFFVDVFEDYRLELVSVLEGNGHLQSVDRVEFDPATDTIVLAVTSNYSTESINNDVAWEITTAFASFWGEEGMAGAVEFPVALHLGVSDLNFTCPGDFMTRLADRRAARSDWVAAC